MLKRWNQLLQVYSERQRQLLRPILIFSSMKSICLFLTGFSGEAWSCSRCGPHLSHCSSLILVPVQKPNLSTVPGFSSPFKEQTSQKRQQNAPLVINTRWKQLEGLENSHSNSFVLNLTDWADVGEALPRLLQRRRRLLPEAALLTPQRKQEANQRTSSLGLSWWWEACTCAWGWRGAAAVDN